MKISYNWLGQFIQSGKSPEELSLILTNIGLEVESLERVQAVAGGLEGLLVGHITACGPHPNADKLKITQVDVGGAAPLQIVCGAANVQQGQKVVVATAGTTVYPVNGEPFKISRSKIRGEVSEGMICAEDEIGLGTSHDGILVLDAAAGIGERVKDHFKLEDDYVFEIGLTPNRADAASHLGVARDVAAYLQIPLTMPDVTAFKPADERLPVSVRVEDAAACPRYSSLSISGVTVSESPGWLKSRLKTIGVRPVNTVVDVTNYVLHELGQPLHAFDADEITSKSISVKKLNEGTSFITLDGVERKLSADDLMICTDDEHGVTKPLCIAGVFGGAASGVKNTTAAVFLESAWFDAVTIRKTAKRHGLKTDASFRFERGTDPDMTVYALKRAALLITELSGGQISSAISDLYPVKAKPFEVDLLYEHTNRLIGQVIPSAEIRQILTRLGIHIANETNEGLNLLVPPYKVDVTREADVIEEILRIYGYNRIGMPAQVRASLSYTPRPDKELVQNQVADLLTANGFNEILSNSLTTSRYSTDDARAVTLINPLSSDLDVMRQTLLFSGLEAISYNQNRKNADLKLYEFGKVYSLGQDKFLENRRLAIFMSGNSIGKSWERQGRAVSFYDIKALTDALLNRLNIIGLTPAATSNPLFASGISYKKGEKTLVELGLVSAAQLKKSGTGGEVFYVDLDWDGVLKAIRNSKIVYREVPKFPSVRRDLSMLLDRSVTFYQLRQIAQATERRLLKDVTVFDVYEGSKLPAGKKSYALSFTLQDDEKTLTDKQIDAIMQKLIANFEKEAGAEIRK